MLNIIIDYLGGNCPVQAEGTVNGYQFYFRSRGSCWSMGIGGGDPALTPDWKVRRYYAPWPAAGYMPLDIAEENLRWACRLWGIEAGRASCVHCADPAAMFAAVIKMSASRYGETAIIPSILRCGWCRRLVDVAGNV